MLRSALAAVLLLAAATQGAKAIEPAEPPASERDAQEMARQGLELLMRALEDLVSSIPQYEMPEINENGDIIIRRKHPPAMREEEPDDSEIKRI